MNAPSMHAERALYRTASKYINYDARLAGASSTAPVRASRNATLRSATSKTRSASTLVANAALGQSLLQQGEFCLTGSALQACIQRARAKLDVCYALCDENVCSPHPDKPGPCRQCETRCDAAFNWNAGQCYDQRCGQGLNCVTNELVGSDAPFVCCPPGTWGCGDACIADCPGIGYVKDTLHCECICASGYVNCGGKCVRLVDDPSHCGSCENGCATGQLCCNGQCKTCTDDSCCGACPNNCLATGSKCCQKNGVYGCATLQEDTSCGSCTNDCTVDGKFCRKDPATNTWGCACPAGQLACGSDCCSAGTDCCRGLCTNKKQYQWDQQNCGTCKKECHSGEVCCKGTCTDIWNDPLHCGACSGANTVCAEHRVCKSGRCICDENGGYFECGADCCRKELCCAGQCVGSLEYFLNNPEHCGSCNNCCTGATSRCCGNQCCEPCNTKFFAGGSQEDVRQISLGKVAGVFEFTYTTFAIADQISILYQGKEIFNSGCTATGGYFEADAVWVSKAISFQGDTSRNDASFVIVRVTPNCGINQSPDTAWQYTLKCP